MIVKYLKFIKESVEEDRLFKTYKEVKDWLDEM
jgi:hypothetical protein